MKRKLILQIYCVTRSAEYIEHFWEIRSSSRNCFIQLFLCNKNRHFKTSGFSDGPLQTLFQSNSPGVKIFWSSQQFLIIFKQIRKSRDHIPFNFLHYLNDGHVVSSGHVGGQLAFSRFGRHFSGSILSYFCTNKPWLPRFLALRTSVAHASSAFSSCLVTLYFELLTRNWINYIANIKTKAYIRRFNLLLTRSSKLKQWEYRQEYISYLITSRLIHFQSSPKQLPWPIQRILKEMNSLQWVITDLQAHSKRYTYPARVRR